MEVQQEVLEELIANRPDWSRGEIRLLSVSQRSRPASIIGFVMLSQALLDDGERDLIAFAIAHSLAMDFFVAVMRRSDAFFDSRIEALDRLSNSLGIPDESSASRGKSIGPKIFGATLSLLTGPVALLANATSLAKTMAEVGELDRESIRRAVAWVSDAGFDARAGVRYFDEGFTALRDFVEPDPTWKTKALRAAFTPSTLVLDQLRKGPDAFLSNAARAEYVEEVCFELGI